MKHRLQRAAAALAAAAFLCAGSAHAAAFEGMISAKRAILLDAASGRVLYEKNADERSLIASTTKIMTGLLVCEAGELDREVLVPPEAVGIEGSSLYLKAGEQISVRELLYGMMLQSGNDAAVALAIAVSGSVDAFVEKMNERALELGLSNTHFENPNGLDGQTHYSTARDLAKLAAAAMENESFRETVSSRSFSSGARSFANHNKLLWRVKGADGVKTGYTKKAGRILAGSACRDGRRLVCVTICDPDDWRDQQTLFDYGFSAFRLQTLVDAGEVLGSVPVVGSQKKRIALIADEAFSYPLAEGEQAETTLHAPGFVYAPVLPGQAGWLEILVNGVRVGEISVSYAQTAEEEVPERGLWKGILGG